MLIDSETCIARFISKTKPLRFSIKPVRGSIGVGSQTTVGQGPSLSLSALCYVGACEHGITRGLQRFRCDKGCGCAFNVVSDSP